MNPMVILYLMSKVTNWCEPTKGPFALDNNNVFFVIFFSVVMCKE